MIVVILILCVTLAGCAGTIENWKPNKETGEMECVQRLKAKGLGDIKGKFEDKSEIDREAYKPIPQIPIKDIEINK